MSSTAGSSHRHMTFMTRASIVSRLNEHNNGTSKKSASTERNELLDHPAMIAAAKSCVFIKDVSRSLGFPARTISTAQLLVHRVYVLRPSPSIGSNDLAIASLLVAAKMEETTKRLRDMLAHSYLLSKQPSDSNFEPQSVSTTITDRMRTSVLAGEQYVMDAIDFDFRTTHPHLLFVKLAKMANVPRQTTAAAGWEILGDAFFTTLPVQFPSSVIAAGALCLAWNLDCEDPKDFTPFVLKLFSTSLQSSSDTISANNDSQDGHKSRSRSGSRGTHRGRRDYDSDQYYQQRQQTANSSDIAPSQHSQKRPETLDLSQEGWWAMFDVSTQDIQNFVRQIVDFYLLFFNSTVLSTEHPERHRNGLPSKEMSQRIGQWRMRLDRALPTLAKSSG
ncbi:RNA polymerase II C-terminal domain kinase beta subunit [Coemansia sp. RSA 988]|nr:RNA polymerase II C-terminal domain kinase beta subunit [Coemansia sp. RSA 988]